MSIHLGTNYTHEVTTALFKLSESLIQNLNEFQSQDLRSSSRQNILAAIQNLMKLLLEQLEQQQFPTFSISSRASWVGSELNDRLTANHKLMRRVDFGIKNRRKNFALLVFILSKVYKLVLTNSTCTKRELFYQYVHVFGKQRFVNDSMENICRLLNCPSWELGILASSKGLVAGSLKITITTSDVSFTCDQPGGLLIPQDVFKGVILNSEAKFALLVEKDAVFQKLIDEGFLERFHPSILITGKGYPDVCTRFFLKCVRKELRIPILALVDCDPYGIEIMATYKYGSLALSHISDTLAEPSIRWLGVHYSDIETFKTPTMPLTHRDVQKARTLLKKPWFHRAPLVSSEIFQLLSNNCKTEIEGIGNISRAYLTDVFIPAKIALNSWI